MNFLENSLRDIVRDHEWADEVVNRLLDSKNLDKDELIKFGRSIQYNDIEECIIYKNKSIGFTDENGKEKVYNSNVIILNFFCWPNEKLPLYQQYLNTNNKCAKANCINNKHYDFNYTPKEENISIKSICCISNYSRDEFDKFFTLSKDDNYFQVTNNDTFLPINQESTMNLDVIFQLHSNKIYQNILDLIGIKLQEPERPVSFMNFSQVIIFNKTLYNNQTNDLSRLANFFRFFCSRLCMKKYFFIKNGKNGLESIVGTESRTITSESESNSKTVKTNPTDLEVINFVMSLIKSNKLFTVEDIQTGIFSDSNNNTTSQTQKPFDQKKTEQLRKEITLKFMLNNETQESIWKSIRTGLNIKLERLRKTKKYKIFTNKTSNKKKEKSTEELENSD